MTVIIKEKYKKYSKESLLDEVYQLGVAYEMHSLSCSQSTVAALYRILEFPSALVKAASSNAGGTAGQLVGTCGGVVGGIMVLDYFFGRPFEHLSDNVIINDPNIEDLMKAIELSEKLPKRYFQEYGTINCVNIQLKLYGRMYYLNDEDEMKKFENAGGHSNPRNCPHIVGNAARWTLSLILENGFYTK